MQKSFANQFDQVSHGGGRSERANLRRAEKEKMHQGSFLVAPEIGGVPQTGDKIDSGIMRSPRLGTFSPNNCGVSLYRREGN